MMRNENQGNLAKKLSKKDIHKTKRGLIFTSVLCMSMLVGCATTHETETKHTQVEEAEEVTSEREQVEQTTFVYGSNDYTRINPAMDEHGEINLLLFDGLMA
ncbi:MAG: hypothetical protein J6B28_00660, partial [Eubacterium sp.]|nr:hypothetical protein [Eubacterium sp.]